MDFDHFYNSNYKSVYRFFYYKGVDKPDCEDLMQEALLRLVKGYQDVITSDTPRAQKILYGICLNLWKGWLEVKKRVAFTSFDTLVEIETESEGLDDFADSPEAGAFEERFAKQLATVKSAILQLNPTVKTVIESRFLKNMTRKQIATKLGMTEDEVHTYQKRGMKYLKEALVGKNVPPKGT